MRRSRERVQTRYWTGAALILVVSATSFALRAQGPGGGQPARPIVPVAASTLAKNPAPYVGELVAVTATVEQVLSKLAFTVDQDRSKSSTEDVLVFARVLNEPVQPNTYVHIVGEVVRFDPAALGAKTKDYPIDLPPAAVEKYKGRPAVLATNVITSSGVDLARRLPPPMSPEEVTYQKVMRQVQTAQAELRKAIEASDVNLAKGNAAILRQAFASTEAFWKGKNKADAVGWAQEGRKHAETIEKAAAAGKWDEVKAAATPLGQVCGTCHSVYRERFDDGSFRIKLGGG